MWSGLNVWIQSLTVNCRLTCACSPKPVWRPAGPCSALAGGFDIAPVSPTWPYDPSHSCSWSHAHRSDADKSDISEEDIILVMCIQTITRSSLDHSESLVAPWIKNKLNCDFPCFSIDAREHKNNVRSLYLCCLQQDVHILALPGINILTEELE